MSCNVAYPELGLIMIRLLLLSRPSRARGLKQAITGLALDAVFASITGAWIETRLIVALDTLERSRPSRARGLKLMRVNSR